MFFAILSLKKMWYDGGMRKKICALLGVMMIVLGWTMWFSPAEAYADNFRPDDGCTKGLLGFRPWYQGLPKGENCTVATPTEAQMPAFIWTIVLNLLAGLFGAIGYLSIIFVIYGGFLFIMAHGDPGKVAKGKKTLTAAVIGVGIALLASVIVNTITGVLSGAFS